MKAAALHHPLLHLGVALHEKAKSGDQASIVWDQTHRVFDRFMKRRLKMRHRKSRKETSWLIWQPCKPRWML
jgi:hypothetical protein